MEHISLRGDEEFDTRLGLDVVETPETRATPQQADALSQAALRTTVDQVATDITEERPSFDGDEPYWTVFRLLVTKSGINQWWSLSDIWQHLNRNYDMSAESLFSVQEAIEQWAEFFSDDAASRNIFGEFKVDGSSYTFVETKPAIVAQTPVEVIPVIRRHPAPKPEVIRERPIERSIIATLRSVPERILKQSEVKKRLAKEYPQLSPDAIQQEIDAMTARGALLKANPDGRAYLFLDTDARIPTKEESVDEEGLEVDANEELDTGVAVDILKALTARGTAYYSRTLSMNELWRVIQGLDTKSHIGTDEEIALMKKTCRQLESAALIKGIGKKGYRVGLADKSKKWEILELLKQTDIEGVLTSRVASDTSSI